MSGRGRPAAGAPIGDWAAALAAGGERLLEDVPAGGLELLWARAASRPRCLWVCADEAEGERTCRLLAGLGVGDVALWPGSEHPPMADVGHDAAATGMALALRGRLAAGDMPQVVVVAAATLLGTWMPRRDFVAACLTLACGQVVDRAELARALTSLGYQGAARAEDEGTYAVRGGTVDVFLAGAQWPVRIDLFGDEIAAMFRFHPDTQAPLGEVGTLRLAPIREVIYDPPHRQRALAWLAGQAGDREQLAWLGEQIEHGHAFWGIEALWPIFYGGGGGGDDDHGASCPVVDEAMELAEAVVVAGCEAVERALAEREAAAAMHQARREAAGRPWVPLSRHLVGRPHLKRQLARRPRLSACALALGGRGRGGGRLEHGLRPLAAAAAGSGAGQGGEGLAPVLAACASAQRAGMRVLLCLSTLGRLRAVEHHLADRRIAHRTLASLPAGYLDDPAAAELTLLPLAWPASLVDELGGWQLLADGDLMGGERRDPPPGRRARPLRRGRRVGVQAARSVAKLVVGDWVLHREHGLGRYRGLIRLLLAGVAGDYLHLEYLDGDRLYVPVYNVAQVMPHPHGKGALRPDKLGGNRWKRAQQRVRDSVLEVAAGLLRMQAERQLAPGLELPAPGEAYRAFAASFPYEETPDQARAISEVLADMRGARPMDRLLCADVGFGKTEVALRATFLAVLGGRQVLVLAPTTVLAEQHRMVFAERLGPFAVEVAALSRFVHRDLQAKVLARLAGGLCDVVVGTHRLLSRDVAAPRLGLLVVDEEQRFGVQHKEVIKRLGRGVHVLSMSATPIPRTLHMAMLGLRDLSIIATAPAGRAAVQTEVLPADGQVMAEAIRRELGRGGQTFVVHNRVQSIAEVARWVAEQVPEARVELAHGQMPADALEQLMVGFVGRRFDVLVATAIIESGIDIPSVNTLIVLQAETFGLGQLHQLRGRIGRSTLRAYAYFMLGETKVLGKEALGRLAALKRFGELGAGFQLASYDLDTRGAGDLLGATQSGNVATVGLEMYGEMLAEAVERARGQGQAATAVEPDIKLPFAVVLPESFVPDPALRVSYYQRMAQAGDDSEVFEVVAEMAATFGDGEAPPAVEDLAEVMVIRRRLRRLGALSLAVRPAADRLVQAVVAFSAAASLDRDDLARRCQRQPDRFRAAADGRLLMLLPLPAAGGRDEAVLPLIRQALGELKCLAGAAGGR